jgi:hypothetical protein
MSTIGVSSGSPFRAEDFVVKAEQPARSMKAAIKGH